MFGAVMIDEHGLLLLFHLVMGQSARRRFTGARRLPRAPGMDVAAAVNREIQLVITWVARSASLYRERSVRMPYCGRQMYGTAAARWRKKDTLYSIRNKCAEGVAMRS